MRVLSVCLGLVTLGSLADAAHVCRPASLSKSSGVDTTPSNTPSTPSSTTLSSTPVASPTTSSATSFSTSSDTPSTTPSSITDSTTSSTPSSTASTTSTAPTSTPSPFQITVSSSANNLDGQLVQWYSDYVSLNPDFAGWHSSPFYLEAGTNYLMADDLYIVWYSENSELFTLNEKLVNPPGQEKIACTVNADNSLSCAVAVQPTINYFYASSSEQSTIYLYMGPTRQNPMDGTAAVELFLTPM